MKSINIQIRVFFLALIPTLILSLLLGTYIVASRIADLERELRLHAEIILNHIVNAGKHGILRENRQTLQDLTNMVLKEKELRAVTFFGPNRELLAYSGDEDPHSADHVKRILFDKNTTSIYEGVDTITFTAPIIINDLDLSKSQHDSSRHLNQFSHKILVGWAAVTLSRSNTLLKEYQVILATLITLTLGLLISVYLARRTAKHLTDPLLKMRGAVRRLERGQLETRIRINTSGEMKELADGINKMALSLQYAQDELQSNIDQATCDLKQSLETIERKNIELAQAQKETLEASRIKSEFIANMSHEVRTPMNGIMGFTNLLLETELTILQRNYLNTIQKSTLNLLNLVNNILDFSRLDAGQLNLEYITFDLRDCIEEIIAMMSPLANAKQLEFVALIDTDVPKKIMSDPLRLKQIILNLISNAIKFTEKGEVIITVSIDKKNERSTKLRIAVSDTGIGLSQADQKLIFRAFQQADNSIARKYGGTGLGLTICKKLIDQMSGKIGLESHPNQGSTFWFTFPIEKTPLDFEIENEVPHFSNLQVVIYEPHPGALQAIKNLLNYWKINSRGFSNLDDFLLELKQTPKPAFVITGINQQHIESTVASNILQKIKNNYSGPIIALTNSSEQAALEYFLAEGAAISLTKPITRNNLYHAIFQLINPSHELTQKKQLQTTNTLRLTNKNILCVDDNIHNAKLIQALLTQTQANTTMARDGREALQLTEKNQYDLILMDIRMPNMDGIECVKHIRASNNSNRNTYIIAVSAHIAEDEYAQLAEAGFNDYLTKPVIKNTLFNALEKWLINPTQPRDMDNEMLTLLIKILPQDFADIKRAFEEKNYSELLQRVHKLHGAICYCGVPALKDATAILETALKKKMYDELETHFINFEKEVNLVLHSTSLA